MRTPRGTPIGVHARDVEVEKSSFPTDNVSDIINMPSVVAVCNEQKVARIVSLLSLLRDTPVGPYVCQRDLMYLDSNLVKAVGSS